VDLNKLNTSDKIIAGSGLVLFIAYFLPWFKVDFGAFGGSRNFSGGDVGFLWSTFPMLIGLVLAGSVIATKMFDVKLPTLPVPLGLAYLGLGGLAALLVILKLLIGEDPTDIVDRAYGLFIATLAAIGLAAGGFLKFQAGEDSAAPGGGAPGSAPF
jgi:hypothetical protein